MRVRDAVRIGLAVIAMGAAAMFAAAQSPGVVDLSGCLGSSDKPCPISTFHVANPGSLQVAQPAETATPQPAAQPTVPDQPTHVQAYSPGVIPCGGCSPSSAAAVATDPIYQTARCSRAYQGASWAIDALYGLIPGVSKDEMLVDSLALADAAQTAAQDPKAAEALCPIQKVEELEQLTAALLAEQGQLKADSEAHQRTDIINRAAGAVRDMRRWLP